MSNCFHHPEAEAVGYCRQCGKALCTDCRRDVRGVIYCEDCLAATVMSPPAAAAPPPGAPNPTLAALLGFIPAVGALYNNEFVKAIVHFGIFAGTITILSSRASRGLEPLLGIFLAAFILYMPYEAYQTAKRRAAGLAPTPMPWQEPTASVGTVKATPIGPLVLIALGTVFLVNSMDIFPFGFHIFRFWPLALIGIGAYMIWQRTGGGAR